MPELPNDYSDTRKVLVVTRTENGFYVLPPRRGDYYGAEEAHVFESAENLSRFIRQWGRDHEEAGMTDEEKARGSLANSEFAKDLMR